MKYLSINFTIYVQDLYTEHYKTPMNATKEDLQKWRDVSYSWIGRLNIVKISILPQLIYRFNTIPVQIPVESKIDIKEGTRKGALNLKLI